MRLWRNQPVSQSQAEQHSQIAPPSERRAPFYRRFAGQIVMSIAASCCGAVIVNFTSIKGAVIYAVSYSASAWVHLWGDPMGGKDGLFTKLEKKVDETLDKVPTVPPVVSAGMIPLPGFKPKSPEELRIEAEQKEAERIRKEKSEITSWLARAESVKFSCPKDWPLEKLRVEVPLAERRAEEAEQRERAAQSWAEEEEHKKELYARADKIGFVAEPSWSLNTLKSKVLVAEEELANDAEYQAKHRQWEAAMKEWDIKRKIGKKGYCSNPRCRNQLDLDGSIYNEQCPVCLTITRKAVARALYAGKPPGDEPIPPRKKPSLIWKVLTGG